MNNGKHPRRRSTAVLAVGGFLVATLLSSTGSISASDPPDSTPEPVLDTRPVDSAPPFASTDIQALKERVPSSLFPGITETLQLSGSSEVYRVVADISNDGAYLLENPVHSLGAKLSTSGISISSAETDDWTWNLKFDGYGRGAILDHVTDPSLTADGGRVEYHYPNGVTEWYVNGPLGLQQGFTFESRPASLVEGPLEVHIAMTGDVTVDVNENGMSALLRSQESLGSLKYGGLYAYDASGEELGARLQATSSGLSIVVDDAGAQYPITIDPFIEKHYLVGTADDRREGFGASVSISGDIVAVGAPHYSWYGIHGVVYLFTVPGSEQTSVPEAIVLTSPRSVSGDAFGQSVSISGDTIVVGAPGERDEELHEWERLGAAYVFEKPSGGWVSTSDASRLIPPNVLSESLFGTSVAISGDTVVVGSQSGSAYVFSKPSGGWADTSEAAKLTASDGSYDDRFGHSVAVNGNTVVIGAYLADLDDDEEEFGAAYVFTKPSDGWTDTSDAVKLTAPDGAEGREFGRSLSVAGDTLVIGAPYTGYHVDYEIYQEAREAEDKTPYLGSVYVYSMATTGWADAASPVKLTAPYGNPWTEFGLSVSVNGDAIAIGEPENRRATQSGGYAYIYGGAAYVFAKPPEGWSSTAEYRELPMPDNMYYDYYGSSVFVSGDFVVVGAPRDGNENGPYAGSAFVFSMPTDEWASDTPLTDPVTLKAFDGPAGDRFGHSVAVDGEMLVVGVPGDHAGVAGAAYVFVRQNTEWEYRNIPLDAPDAVPGGRFGTSVAVGQDTVVVGAPGTEEGNDPGAAYVFTRPEEGWDRTYSTSTIAKLTMPDVPDDGRYGYSVATDGDTIVVGTPGVGAAYVYTRPDMGWSHVSSPAKLTSPNVAPNSRFGHAVSLSGDTIVVGDPGEGSGVAYAFTKPDSGWADTSTAAKLTASDGASGDRFGYAVSANGVTVLVGAPGNENGEGNGAAYVFTEPDTGWSNTSASAKLTASDGAADDWFGHAVSVSDQFIAVGAHGTDNVAEDQELVDSGAVYAFRQPQGGWATSSDAQKVTAKRAAPGDTFGYAVSVNGDTLAVGLPNDIVSESYYLRGAHSGSARVFSWPGLFWIDTPAAFKITPPNAESSRIFGVSLSADGDTAVVGTVQSVATETSTVGTAKAFVYIRQDGEWDTATSTALTLPDGGSFVSHGLAVSENGDTVAVGFSPTSPETTPKPNSVLVFTRPEDGWVSTSVAAELTMPDGEFEGSFGQAVSISGDSIVVGAYGDDSYYYTTSHRGAAFVFTRPEGGWVSTSAAAKLTAPAGDPGDQFGRAVSVSGDTIVITAPGDRDIIGYRVGSAYVFARPTGGWVSTSDSVKLVAPDGWSSYWTRNDFGSSVSVMGDKIVIGAPDYYRETSAAYVFTKPPDGWDNPYIVSKLTAPQSESSSYFGTSVSMSDDAIYVGTRGSPGQVFVFPIPTGRATFTGSAVRLWDPQGGVYDAFGGVVSAGGNGVAVGALYSDDHGEDFGAAYIFTEPTDGWSFSHGPMGQTAQLVSPDWHRGHLFGLSISPSTDAIGIGAPSSRNVNDPGAAYVFSGPFESLYARDDAAKLSPPDGDAENGFGWSVSLNSDVMAVGAPGFSSGTGATYLFTKPDEGWVSTSEAAKLTSPRGEMDSNFGYSVSLGAGAVAVGAIREDEAGSAYLFTKPEGGTWQSSSDAIELTAPGGEGSPSFGWSVAITDDTLVVGMPSMSGLGAVYLYTKPADGWASISAPVKLTPSDGRNGDMFGASVAISGATIVVGAVGTVDYDFPGAVYVYTKPATGWESTSDAAKLTPEVSESRDGFGWSVAVAGDTVVIGGQNHDSYYRTNGAYVFTKPQGGWGSASAPPINVVINRYGYSYDQLGLSAGVTGDNVFVGRPSVLGNGVVYVYEDFFDG